MCYPAFADCLHRKGQHSHCRNLDDESTSVTKIPVIAIRTPNKVNIASMDQEEWVVSGSKRSVVFVCEGGAGIACTTSVQVRMMCTRLRLRLGGDAISDVSRAQFYAEVARSLKFASKQGEESLGFEKDVLWRW
jgi:hypothetical protein